MANISTITYNGSVLAETEEEGNVAVVYDGNTIANIAAGETKTLLCNGKVMKTNLYIGAKTLLCEMAQMISDIIVAVKSAFPEEPTAYSLISTYTSSQTWTAPEDGYFQVEVHGASGNGGSGVSWRRYYPTSGIALVRNGAGGGGGGGGYACSRIKMKAGDTITLVPAAVGSASSATINSSVESYSALSVTSGANGGNGSANSSTSTGGTGGTGGTASGGNYANVNGGAGGEGSANGTTASAPTAGAGGASGHTGGNAGGTGGTGYTLTANMSTETFSGASGSAGFIKIYRGNTNLGGADMGTVFYIQSFDGSVTQSFEFEEGMTWAEFIDSSYNDGKFVKAADSGSLPVDEVNYPDVTIAGFIGYNGYILSSGSFDNISNIGAIDSDVIEVGKTYYSNGVL